MVSHRLRRVDDQVVAARPRRDGAASFSASRSGQLGRARRPSPSRSPVRYSQPRPTGGAMRAHGVEGAGLWSAPMASSFGSHAHPLLGGAWCPRGRRRTCSPATWSSVRGRVVDAAAPSSRWLQSASSVDLLGRRHVERVDLVGRDPGRVVVHRLGASSTGSRLIAVATWATATACLGDPDAPRRRSSADAGGEPPGAVVDDADGEADVVGVDGAPRRRRARGAWLRIRSSRKSAWLTSKSWARVSAASASCGGAGRGRLVDAWGVVMVSRLCNVGPVGRSR